jgi:hypothetical protein
VSIPATVSILCSLRLTGLLERGAFESDHIALLRIIGR